MKVLQVIDTAYRCTIEEQDDTIVWLTHAMKGAGAELDVLLRGNAVNYALNDQDASGLTFGTASQTQPPRIAQDLAGLMAKGVTVYVVTEDVADRGIAPVSLLEGLQAVPRARISQLFGRYERIWHW